MSFRRFYEFLKESNDGNQVLAKIENGKNALQNMKNHSESRKVQFQFRETILQNTNETQKEIRKKQYENHFNMIFQGSNQTQKNTNSKDPKKFEKKNHTWKIC
jgi:predicted ATP-dependent endonuclease of OLD family